jgi:glycosyltransferase involved in cell wall biosynthesis
MRGASSEGSVRVLLVCDFFLKYTAALAAGLDGAGADVALISRDHDFEFGGAPGSMRREVAAVLPPRVPHLRLAGRVRDLGAWGDARRVRGHAKRFGAAVVHVQDSVANDPRLALVSGAAPRRFALTLHDPTLHPGDRPHGAAKRSLRKWLIRAAGLIFVHAEALEQELRDVYRPRAPVVVIPHGSHVGDPTPLPESPSLLFFGRVSYYKGLDVLLDAMPLLWQSRPEVRLTIAGRGVYPDHPVLGDSRVTVRAEYIPDTELPSLFSGASCVVLPYRQASQSGVGSHAREFGRALVVSAVGGLPELVTPETGRLVQPGDPAELAATCAELLADRDRLQAMGSAAAELASASAGWDTVARLTLEAYRRHLRV